MRRILILLLIVAVCAAVLAALWIFRGGEISSFIDRYWTVETASSPIQSLTYDGNGNGGILIVNQLSLSLNEVGPGVAVSVGTTKDNQLALASGGKVFPFGPVTSASENSGDHLATLPPQSDQAFLVTRHSVLSWPTAINFDFVTRQSTPWKRQVYYEVRWKKSSGARLQMLWRYEQSFHPGNGWGNPFMTRAGSTGLIRVDISE